MIKIHSIHIGQPRTITDESGTWRSSIFREAVTGTIELGARGLTRDQVTDTKNHGSPDQAVCCHSLDHYDYWNDVYGLESTDRALGPGSVGENWTLIDADETDICIGDVYGVGGARVQVSGPRVPCYKQGRKLALPDFRERTLDTLRTGFYLRVLTPGVVQAGDGWISEERPWPSLTLSAVNRCGHHELDVGLAERLIDTPELSDGWRRILRRKLANAAST
jgi:MOSC domain-containing protein YiiM